MVFGLGWRVVLPRFKRLLRRRVPGMARRPAKVLKSREVQGAKYVERLLSMLDALHEVGCERHKCRQSLPVPWRDAEGGVANIPGDVSGG